MTDPTAHRSPRSTSLPVPSAAVKQIDGLQILRAVAVAIVAWGHAGLFYMSPEGTHLPDLGVFGIDIFFVLSGFILTTVILRSRLEPGFGCAWRFLQRRLMRIFPIYWLFACISLAMLLHRHDLRAGYVYSLFLLPFPRYPSTLILVGFTWTLMYEMFFYVTLALIQVFTVKRAAEVLICTLVALTMLRLAISIRQPVLIVAANPILLEFVLGAVIALLYRARGAHTRAGAALIVAGSAAAIGFLVAGISSPTQQMILVDDHVLFRVGTWGMAAAAIVWGTALCRGNVRGRSARLLLALGNASYSAYLASALTIYALSRVLQRFVPHQPGLQLPARAACQVISVLGVLLAGLATYQVIERPMLRYLQRRLP